jgi:peptide/nickel transport system permease protein
VLTLNVLGDGIRDQLGAGLRRPPRPSRAARPSTPATPAGSDTAIVDVAGLTISFPDDGGGTLDVVTDVSFQLERGEVVGLVGESGCGKTITAMSLLGLVPAPGRASGSIRIDGRQIVGARERELKRVRGGVVGLVFQDPVSSLDPAFTIGDQIAEAIELHTDLSRRDVQRRVVELLEQVGIPDAERRAKAYPHEFSGGMAQRVMIAAALAADPQVLIADEPTTALDVTVQADILELLRRLQVERQLTILLVTHDLGVVADLCQRAIVMYAGEIAEQATVEDLFASPQHPYTKALLASLPEEGGRGRLGTIAGTVPAPDRRPPGCRFAPRCAFAMPECSAGPIELRQQGDRAARCILVPGTVVDR